VQKGYENLLLNVLAQARAKLCGGLVLGLTQGLVIARARARARVWGRVRARVRTRLWQGLGQPPPYDEKAKLKDAKREAAGGQGETRHDSYRNWIYHPIRNLRRYSNLIRPRGFVKISAQFSEEATLVIFRFPFWI
jgi:hypothetical protein